MKQQYCKDCRFAVPNPNSYTVGTHPLKCTHLFSCVAIMWIEAALDCKFFELPPEPFKYTGRRRLDIKFKSAENT